MRAAILEAPRQLTIQEVPDPQPSKGGLVVDIRMALTCGTDVKTYMRGHPKIPLPSMLGHEFAGVVSAVGEGVEKFQVGDEIMAVHSAPCNECFYCAQGLQNLCESVMETKVLGAYAEKIALPAHITAQNVFIKPPEMRVQTAAFLEPLSCVVHGMNIGAAALGEAVVVIGAGPIGLLFTALLHAEGCTVFVVEPNDRRREKAKQMGADEVYAPEDNPVALIREITGGHGADLAVECTGNETVWETSPSFVRKGGRILLFGGPPSGVRACFDAGRLHYDQIALLGCFHFTPVDVAAAAELLISGRVDPNPLITGVTKLGAVGETLENLAAGQGIKVMVLP